MSGEFLRRDSDRRSHLALLAALALATPVLVGTGYSAAAAVGLVGAGADGLTAKHLTHTLLSTKTWVSVGWTLWTAGLATVLSTLLAVVMAGAIERSRVGRAVALVPLALPHGAAALAMLLLLSQSGLLARAAYHLGWIATPGQFPALVYDAPGIGLILAFVWKEFPFLLLAALAVRETHGRALDEAARTLGASTWATWRRITAPLLLRGVAPSAIAVLAFLLGQYEMTLLLAPSDPLALPLLTTERTTDPDLSVRGEAHVLALIALTLAWLLVVLHERTQERVEEQRREPAERRS